MHSLDKILKAKVIALDFETAEEKEHNIPGEPLLVSLAAKVDKKFIAKSFDVDEINIKEIFENKIIVMHNAKFDLKVAKVYYGIDLEKIKFQDTMIMSWLLDETRRKGLKELAKEILGMKMDKFKDIDQSNIELFKEYNKNDALATIRLWYKFRKDIIKEKLEIAYELELKLVPVIIDMELAGVKIDMDFHNKLRKYLENKRDELEKKLYKKAGDIWLITSSQQVGRFIIEVLKINAREEWYTTKGNLSTSESVLNSIVDDEAISENKKKYVEYILEHRHISKLLSTYLKMDKIIGNDGRLRAEFNQVGTVTGRFSSSNPNLQNQPKEPFDEDKKFESHIRNMYIADKGKKLLVGDYSQIELRLMAYWSKDDNMIKAFKNGEDLHQQTADEVGCSRKHAKSLNFGKIYGMSYFSFAQSTGMSPEEALEYFKRYDRKYPKVEKFIRNQIELTRKRGYIRTFVGRKRRFPDILSDNRGIRAASERMAINTTIQGSAADVIKLAMIKIWKKYRKDIKILIQVHDELVMEVDEDKAEKYYEIIKYEMEKVLDLGIPLEIDLKIVDRWGEAK